MRMILFKKSERTDEEVGVIEGLAGCGNIAISPNERLL